MAKIDDRVEALVREALAAVVGKDPERLQGAIAAFPDDESLAEGIRLSIAISMYAMEDLHEGLRPTVEELSEVASDIERNEEWTGVAVGEIVTYFNAAYDKKRVDQVLPTERAIILAFVTAASLVSSYRNDDEEWWNYLDRAEQAIEATSSS